jgi:DNA repair exonuclease SbcCD nuclease subunit
LEPVTLRDGLTLWGAAHRAPANTDGFLEDFRVDRGGVHIALFHGSEQRLLAFQESGKAPHAPFRKEQIAAAGLAHAFLGHFHTPVDDDSYTYPGNPEPLTFGEEGVRGPVVATISTDGSVQRDRRRIATGAMTDVVVDVTGCTSKQDVRQRVREGLAGAGGIVRVTLSGEIDPDVELGADDVRDVAPHLDALVPRIGTLQPAYDLDFLAGEPTVRGQFVKDVRASDLDADEKRRVLTVGLRALAGRFDLEVSE